ncbi:FGGY-family carbohydrate kinase [Thermosipho atlanticus]|uniref:Sugar (Pentulose or hexulose) kinase n=1 Tax=Thermosipho atlanticus DSM 15807 TaxID=1123380 RepID=A0A1M5TLC5_9BACT|nr:FGGY-family carbohydrate kinase [Thermosipho atlanticus]SHH51488.1 Sugar (pentulose or hexulose) kinase [Thermosipho atlanticus DSM 15807]
MKELALSIDCGTQSLRAILFDEKGNLVDMERVKFNPPYFSKYPGWAEQDPELYWKSMIKAIRKLEDRNKKRFSKIIGVTVTTQRDTVVLVDENGKPVRPAILWVDQRKALKKNPLNFFENIGFVVINKKNTAIRAYRRSRPNWIKENEKDIWKKTHKFLLLSGYFLYKLTGQFIDSKASQIGHIPFDYKNQNWTKSKRHWRWRIFGVEVEKLPKLVGSCEKVGIISEKVAEETGIPKGIPIITSGSDKGCETIGVGCFNTDSASLSFGTTATVQTTSKRYFEVIPFIPPYPAVVPGYYNPEIEIFRGYWLISWFLKEFGITEMEKARKLGVSPEVLLEPLLNSVPPGSQGLVLHPMWTPGIDMPNAKGAIIGFGDVHTRAHVYRAIVEGINYALRDGLERIEKRGKVKVKKLMVSGGGSQSEKICQITANMFNLPVLKTQTHETAGLGAAICVFTGIGYYNSIFEAVKNMVTYSKTYEPQKDEVEIYEELYNKVYKKIYKSLKRINIEIKKITKYPDD